MQRAIICGIAISFCAALIGVILVLKNYSIPEAVALGCICSLIEEQKNKKKLSKDINMFLIKDNMYQVINRRMDKLFL